MTSRPIALNESWLKHLQGEFDLPYMRSLDEFLQTQKHLGKVIYPSSKNIFASLNAIDLERVKVVILGQDPYHGANQAHGLSFSVPKDQAIPPSLRNIYKELNTDLGISPSQQGYLMPWAQQGVLLLNSVLTVEHSLAASHQGKGWEQFTDKVIGLINLQRTGVVFMLWGSYAQAKGKAIDSQKHLVLKAPHPSPLSAYRGFFGCKHFSQANQYLNNHRNQSIEWSLRKT
ncbi:MAG: uracil-DNA glycosylase [Saprospiraceae bacterium]|jgi:uracil-DNA glycosylase